MKKTKGGGCRNLSYNNEWRIGDEICLRKKTVMRNESDQTDSNALHSVIVDVQRWRDENIVLVLKDKERVNRKIKELWSNWLVEINKYAFNVPKFQENRELELIILSICYN